VLPHLTRLEDEAIYILREACAERERPALLFSGGKDSIVLLRLAEKAFRPARLPFPLLHVDTGQNFDEVIAFRDAKVAELGERLIVAEVQRSIDRGTVREDTGPRASRNRLQSTTLLEAIAEHELDVLFGGARRDEDRARAKERIVSVRDELGQWNPSAQRPELWSVLNLHIRKGQHLRVFPISNWTELDVWEYIAAERLALPSIYFAHRREVFERDRMLYGVTQAMRPAAQEPVFEEWVRFRTVGDATCTGAVRSKASTIEEVITEIIGSDITERGATRADDKFSEAAMEDRKREGYF
jgi:sulfate adenylyltransferase subunit 2